MKWCLLQRAASLLHSLAQQWWVKVFYACYCSATRKGRNSRIGGTRDSNLRCAVCVSGGMRQVPHRARNRERSQVILCDPSKAPPLELCSRCPPSCGYVDGMLFRFLLIVLDACMQVKYCGEDHMFIMDDDLVLVYRGSEVSYVYLPWRSVWRFVRTFFSGLSSRKLLLESTAHSTSPFSC